eukprot:TRINITY_DN26424_c0_g6_i1.p1 TRINITY_DN26424_c0_g6~~TRINITY_DN26424_c0_g6_i1.p1  ORF type:complete len:558 (-),score=135.06 TRINITY_DN26424_c0_g6_i1:232-1905(-)
MVLASLLGPLPSATELAAMPLGDVLSLGFLAKGQGWALATTLVVVAVSARFLLGRLLASSGPTEDYVIDPSIGKTFKVVGKNVDVTVEKVPTLVEEMRTSFNAGITMPISKRLEQLHALKRLLEENEEAIKTALKEDLNRPHFEGLVYDILVPCGEVDGAIANLRRWSAPARKGFCLLTFPSSQWIQKEPMGLCLIMSTWNYPFMLSFAPLVGAIAAGNTVILKPCNVASKSARLQAELVARYLDPRVVSCVGGAIPDDKECSNALLQNKFDTVFFTGSTAVGTIVAQAAAKHLTRCILELGGKNPTFVDGSANVTMAAKRIMWGRLLNSGQQCIAPDYVFCHKSILDKFCSECARWVQEFHGSDSKKAEDFGRIINDARMEQLKKLLSSHGGSVVFGGDMDMKERYVAPTLVKVSLDSPVMREETFGPILWVVPVDSMDEGIAYLKGKAKPLSLYVFADDSRVARRIVQNTSSGGVGVNGTLFQAGHSELPFGGVGESGMGAYHGKATFDAFTHEKPVLAKTWLPDFGALSDPFFLYSPWGRGIKNSLIRLVMKLG